MKRRKKYEAWLEQILSDVFESAADVWNISCAELSRRAGVSTTTVYSLRDRLHPNPRIKTVFAVCRAVGMDLELVKEAAGMKKAA